MFAKLSETPVYLGRQRDGGELFDVEVRPETLAELLYLLRQHWGNTHKDVQLQIMCTHIYCLYLSELRYT